MTYGLRTWDMNTGAQTFDSSTDLVLFGATERFISGNSEVGSGAGLMISYPQFQGKKIVAFMMSPFGEYLPDQGATLSCRISYPNGTPTVRVFVDNNIDPINGQPSPIHDGYLVVMWTGAGQ